MKIVFMGTPDFAAASLSALIEAGREPVGVFTQPDRPSGRGMSVKYSPVKELALKHNIPVYQPEKMRDGTALSILRELNPDLIVVVAYGRILPNDILELPKYGCINVHGSLLPAYRGSAPIQWAVLNGDSETGVSTMYLAEEMDTGDVIFTDKTEIGEFETSGELFDRLMVMGASLLLRTVDAIENGTAPGTAQDNSKATYTVQLTKEHSPINWNRSPRQIVKQIYGLQPWPVATTQINGDTLKIYEAAYTETATDALPGTVIGSGKTGLEIACGEGKSLLITSIQAPGKKRMAAADYLRGHSIPAGVRCE